MSALARGAGRALATLRRWPSMLWRLEARLKGVEFQGRADILGRPVISLAPGSRIVLGANTRVFSSRRGNLLSLARPCTLRALASGAAVLIGRDVGLSGATICAGGLIEIGEGTIIGAEAMLIDNDFHQPAGAWGWADECRANARPIRVGRGVFVGARAIVLKGVTIGDRAIIGAGAVVTRDVPSGFIAAGNPAQVFAPAKAMATPATPRISSETGLD